MLKSTGHQTPRQNKSLNLEGFRGILALMVLISHIDLLRFYFGRAHNLTNPYIFHFGRVAVTGFFVLSGYLITLSILKRRENNTWNLRDFYLRRIFRIWPMYFLMIVLALLVFPHIPQLKFILPEPIADVRTHPYYFWYYIFFLPQFPICLTAVLPFAEPTWSVGVEEFFYLIVPFVIIYIKKNLPGKLMGFILVFVAVRLFLFYVVHIPPTSFLAGAVVLHRYDAVALGCLLGVMHFNGHKLFSTIKLWHVLLAMVAMAFNIKYIPYTNSDYSLCTLGFGVILIYLAGRSKGFLSVAPLVYLGKISYGFYLVHEVAIVFCLNVFPKKASYVLLCSGSILIALGIASVLYFLVEKPFIDFAASRFSAYKAVKQKTT